MLVGKPGLDGHSNGAEQIAVRARDAGIEVVYEGIRLTPAQIVNAALEEGVHVVGLSILSGSHVALVTEVLERLRRRGSGTFRSSSAASSRRRTSAAEGRRGRADLHAEGLRPDRHHERHRRAGGRAGRKGGVASRERVARRAGPCPTPAS